MTLAEGGEGPLPARTDTVGAPYLASTSLAAAWRRPSLTRTR